MKKPVPTGWALGDLVAELRYYRRLRRRRVMTVLAVVTLLVLAVVL